MADVSQRGHLLLISDGGATIKYQESAGLLPAFRRYIGIPLNQVGALRRRWVRARNADPADRLKAAVWSISNDTSSAPSGGYSSEQAQLIAGIRTDLDAFSDAEMAILENQGYLAADVAISAQLPESSRVYRSLQVPWPEYLDGTVVSKALQHSHQRVPVVGRYRLGAPTQRMRF